VAGSGSVLNAVRQTVYVKVAGPAEPASYRWTLSDYRRVAGGLTTYSGVDTANPVDAAATSVSDTATAAVTAPSVTTTVSGALLVHLAAINADADLSAPAGMIERWEADSPNLTSTRDLTTSQSDGPFSGPAPTGTRTATSTRSGRSVATLLALRPSG
jgi:hypothetical protein